MKEKKSVLEKLEALELVFKTLDEDPVLFYRLGREERRGQSSREEEDLVKDVMKRRGLVYER